MSYLKTIHNTTRYVLVAGLLVGLVGCGGGDEVEGGTPGTGGIGGEIGNSTSNPPLTIAITYPYTNALQDLGGGIYRMKGSVVVTDSEGNAVADGTRVNLFLIDSIIAKGTITPGTDSITSTTLTDTAPLLADDTPTTLNGAYVIRNSAYRFIEANDHVLLFNSDEVDKIRIVNPVSASNPSNTTVNVTSSYINTYPNAVYDGVTILTEYKVGASLLGTNVEGEGGTSGYVSTTNGIGTFYITYPANVNYMRAGCAPTIDTRFDPMGSAEIYLLASADSNINATAVDNSFCFFSIIGGEITGLPDISGTGSTIVSGLVRDGGDSVPLPFIGVTASVDSSGGAGVVVSSPITTNEFGYFTATLTVSGASGASAVVTFQANGGATGTVNVTIP